MKRTTRRGGYRDAVRWVAHNDNAGTDDGAYEIAGYVSTLLVADLFGADPDVVAKDILRVRRKEVRSDDTG